ncbi:MarR family winged helix-turn-helix transcriptional regulator [Microbispora bryophytorum]|uniref:MarR family winged helix-turn-helix transcriptional regulator n=1 Tax=Microbispora bryophytorum TaxID=1460882 RepID=UPI0033D2195A
MTVNPESRPSLGRAFGETARLIGKLHRRALADFDSDFPTWMLLTLLWEAGAPLPLDEVAKELDRGLDLAEPDTMRVLERAVAAGHIAYRPESASVEAELTEAGTDHFTALYAYARKVTDAVFEGIDPAELDTALTVVLAARERAAATLGRLAGA